ncbi:MAG: purine-nucleoside phosphorylase [Desulfomicrobiaceae bacterium]
MLSSIPLPEDAPPFSRARRAAAWLREHLHHPCPATVVVAGSGLGEVLSADAEILERMAYPEIPEFPRSTAPGHAGELIILRLRHTPVALLSGRFHLYEGYTSRQIVRPLRALGLLGARRVVLTNAAGGLNPLFAPGSLMAITDHINFTGHSPLTGPNDDAVGPRFPDMSQVYCPRLRARALTAAMEAQIRLECGVYVGITGPQLETPAETRMFRTLGADAIGMSTVLEAIAAHHMGMQILGISCIANQNLPDCMEAVSIETILAQAAQAGKALRRLLDHLIPTLEEAP